MERYQRKFVEEAKELLSSLESGLLELEESPNRQRVVDEVFRVMHSLKGSGAMFGFNRISNLTHQLEDVFSSIRSGSLSVSKHLIDLSFSSIDLIRELLKGAESDKEINRFHELSDKISALSRYKNPVTDKPNKHHLIQEGKDEAREGAHCIWLIQFKPHPTIMVDGNNPVYLFDELATMGVIVASPIYHKLMDCTDEFHPELLYINWNILLESNASKEEIANVFLFVSEQSDIQITLVDEGVVDCLESKKESAKSLLATDFEMPKLKALFRSDNPAHFVDSNQVRKEVEPVSSSDQEISDNEDISIRVPSIKLDELMNLVSELITTQGQLQTISERINVPNLSVLSEKYEKLIRQLREQAMEMSLVSINTLVVRLKRLVRDQSQLLNKEVDLVIVGGETELDKTIIEHLSEPLMHLLRNAIDHGIEDKQIRQSRGKSPQGEIRISAFYSGSEVHIEVRDDGNGIDTNKIIEKAYQLGRVQSKSQQNGQEILKLLFAPGFSTREEANEFSGRGVGLDVVYRKIADLRGDVEISSELGRGTRFLIKLPLTLTIMDGMLTVVGATKYIIPISAVRKIYEVQLDVLEGAFNKLITLDGQQYPFLLLCHEFEEQAPRGRLLQLILVEYEEKRIGLVIDQILGERQVVLKPLGKSLRNNRIFSGGCILGDGEIALVLDTNKLIKEFTSDGK